MLFESLTYAFMIIFKVRVSFLPWGSMLDLRALATDGLADALTIINVLLTANIAYRNSKGLLVTKRYKIFRQEFCLTSICTLQRKHKGQVLCSYVLLLIFFSILTCFKTTGGFQ